MMDRTRLAGIAIGLAAVCSEPCAWAQSAAPSGAPRTPVQTTAPAGGTARPAPTASRSATPHPAATPAHGTASAAPPGAAAPRPAPGAASSGSPSSPPPGGATVTRTGQNGANVDFAGDDVQGTRTNASGASTQVRAPGHGTTLIRTRENFRDSTLRGVENRSTP